MKAASIRYLIGDYLSAALLFRAAESSEGLHKAEPN